MGFASILKWLAPLEPVDDYQMLQPGRSHIRGTIQGGLQLLTSPIESIPCVAFFYRAWYMAAGRMGFVQRELKSVEVYAPEFYLDMGGGRVRVIHKTPGSFDTAEHLDLQTRGFQGLKQTEQPLKPDDRISILGPLRKDGEEWTIVPKEIRVVEIKPPKKSSKKKKKLR